MKKKIIPVIIVLGLIGGAYYYFYHYKAEQTIDNNITLYGNIDIRQVDLAFRVPGRIKEMIYDEGDLIEAGQVIARLDQTTFNEDLERARAELSQARANQQKLINGTRPQEIKQAQALANEAEAAYKNAVTFYDREVELAGTGASSEQDLDNALAQKTESEARLKKAKEAYNLAVSGFRQEDKNAGKAAVQVAEAVVSSAQTNLNDTEIIAPNEGIILTRIEEPGAIVNSSSPVYTLSLTKPVWVRAYVNEKELGLIYPGMKAKVYTDSAPDKPYDGKIGFISPVAEFTPKTVETTALRTDLVYRIRVIINKPDQGLRQGMPVTVKIDKTRPEKVNDR